MLKFQKTSRASVLRELQGTPEHSRRAPQLSTMLHTFTLNLTQARALFLSATALRMSNNAAAVIP